MTHQNDEYLQADSTKILSYTVKLLVKTIVAAVNPKTTNPEILARDCAKGKEILGIVLKQLNEPEQVNFLIEELKKKPKMTSG